MKNILLSIVMVLFCAPLMAQKATSVPKADVFLPSTLTAGTAMTGRTGSTTYDDTTRGFNVRNYSQVYVGLETAANDSGTYLLAYSISHDGTTYQTPILFDSLATSGQVGISKYFALPANAMGAVSVRIRVYGSTSASVLYSAAPVQTVTTKIIRKQQ